MRHSMRMLVKDSRSQDGIDVKDKVKGSNSRSQSMKEQAYNKEQRERPRPHELNDKSNLIDLMKESMEATIEMLKFHLKRAQDRMKNYADKKRSEREFEVGMWVYLKLQPHRQVTIRHEQQLKLSAKYYGPFMTLAKVGTLAYKLELPSTSQIHPVFQISQLKLCKGSTNKMGILPHCGVDGLLSMEPEAILDRRMAKLKNKADVYVLVKWANYGDEDAT
ncbi:retrotransposable element Tf2 [Tanacetum coccineum]|uniref:Retrotransposable element Tf2 n=1 Tax=Tanacetum coccineum TaxID=301880 RepID=A0ABQ5EMX1_9ASTR